MSRYWPDKTDGVDDIFAEDFNGAFAAIETEMDDKVSKEQTIAGLSLNTNITTSELQTALGFDEQSIKGDKGDTGATGPKGDKGDKGDTGATPNIAIGTVETVENSEDAEVTRRVGTPNENPILDFKLPKGVSGVYVGSGTMPEGFNVQVDPTGEVTPIIMTDVYDTVIATQAQFDDMLTSNTWNGAKNVLFTCGVTATSAFTVPNTVHTIEFNNYTLTIDSETFQEDTFDFHGCTIHNIKIFIQQGRLIFSNINGLYNCKIITPDRGGTDPTLRKLTIDYSNNIFGFQYTSHGIGSNTEGVALWRCTNIYNCVMHHNDGDTAWGISSSKYLCNCDISGDYVYCYADCTYLVNCRASIKYGYGCFDSCSYMSNCKAEVDSLGAGRGFLGTTIACDSETCVEVVQQ